MPITETSFISTRASEIQRPFALLQRKAPTLTTGRLEMNLQTASYQELAAERREKNTNDNFLKPECVGSTMNTGAKSLDTF